MRASARVTEWLDASRRLVRVIDPDRRHARLYRADGNESLVGAENRLEGDVVPGFC